MRLHAPELQPPLLLQPFGFPPVSELHPVQPMVDDSTDVKPAGPVASGE
jgi:hypothetical protein